MLMLLMMISKSFKFSSFKFGLRSALYYLSNLLIHCSQFILLVAYLKFMLFQFFINDFEIHGFVYLFDFCAFLFLANHVTQLFFIVFDVLLVHVIHLS